MTFIFSTDQSTYKKTGNNLHWDLKEKLYSISTVHFVTLLSRWDDNS